MHIVGYFDHLEDVDTNDDHDVTAKDFCLQLE